MAFQFFNLPYDLRYRIYLLVLATHKVHICVFNLFQLPFIDKDSFGLTQVCRQWRSELEPLLFSFCMVFEHQSLKKYFNHYNRTVLEENWARHNTVGGISGALQLVQNLVLQERVAMPVSNVFFDKFPNLKSLNLTMARMEHPNYCDECKRGVCLTAKDQSIAKILMHWNQLHTTARAIYDEDPANRGSTYDGPLQEAQDKFYYNFFKDVLLRVHSNRSQMRVLVQTLVYIPRQGDVESCYWGATFDTQTSDWQLGPWKYDDKHLFDHPDAAMS